MTATPPRWPWAKNSWRHAEKAAAENLKQIYATCITIEEFGETKEFFAESKNIQPAEFNLANLPASGDFLDQVCKEQAQRIKEYHYFRVEQSRRTLSTSTSYPNDLRTLWCYEMFLCLGKFKALGSSSSNLKEALKAAQGRLIYLSRVSIELFPPEHSNSRNPYHTFGHLIQDLKAGFDSICIDIQTAISDQSLVDFLKHVDKSAKSVLNAGLALLVNGVLKSKLASEFHVTTLARNPERYKGWTRSQHCQMIQQLLSIPAVQTALIPASSFQNLALPESDQRHTDLIMLQSQFKLEDNKRNRKFIEDMFLTNTEFAMNHVGTFAADLVALAQTIQVISTISQLAKRGGLILTYGYCKNEIFMWLNAIQAIISSVRDFKRKLVGIIEERRAQRASRRNPYGDKWNQYFEACVSPLFNEFDESARKLMEDTSKVRRELETFDLQREITATKELIFELQSYVHDVYQPLSHRYENLEAVEHMYETGVLRHPETFGHLQNLSSEISIQPGKPLRQAVRQSRASVIPRHCEETLRSGLRNSRSEGMFGEDDFEDVDASSLQCDWEIIS